MIFIILCCLGTLLDGQPILKLPPKSVSLTKMDFSSDESFFYKGLEASSRSEFKVSLLKVL